MKRLHRTVDEYEYRELINNSIIFHHIMRRDWKIENSYWAVKLKRLTSFIAICKLFKFINRFIFKYIYIYIYINIYIHVYINFKRNASISSSKAGVRWKSYILISLNKNHVLFEHKGKKYIEANSTISNIIRLCEKNRETSSACAVNLKLINEFICTTRLAFFV